MILIDKTNFEEGLGCALCSRFYVNPITEKGGCDGLCETNKHLYAKVINTLNKSEIKPKTNGDMIETLFNVTEKKEYNCCIFVNIHPLGDCRFTKEWWYAPYEEKNNV